MAYVINPLFFRKIQLININNWFCKYSKKNQYKKHLLVFIYINTLLKRNFKLDFFINVLLYIKNFNYWYILIYNIINFSNHIYLNKFLNYVYKYFIISINKKIKIIDNNYKNSFLFKLYYSSFFLIKFIGFYINLLLKNGFLNKKKLKNLCNLILNNYFKKKKNLIGIKIKIAGKTNFNKKTTEEVKVISRSPTVNLNYKVNFIKNIVLTSYGVFGIKLWLIES